MSRTLHEEEAEEIELEELPPLIADQPDGVAELDSEAPELKKRVYEVLRMRVHVKGDFLHASLADVHHGVRNSNTPSVIFAHPLGSLSKLPIQVLLLVYGLYFGVSTIFEGLRPMSLNKIRHIRFSTLETRVPKSTLTNVGISRLSLLLSSRRNDPLRPGTTDDRLTHTHTHTHAYTHAHTHAHTHTHTRTHTNAHAHLPTYLHAYLLTSGRS